MISNTISKSFGSRLGVFILVSMLWSLTISVHVSAQGLELFTEEEPLKVIIKTDMKNLLKMTKEDKYQKALMVINDEEWKIRVRPRGNNRFETCSFPPITLNFKKTEFKDSTYYQLTKLKLVNSCELQLEYEQYLLREYLIYKMFNLLTEYSFRVRLLELEYIDTEDKMKPIVRYGFVIEDQDMMAKRLNGVVIDNLGLHDKMTNMDQITLISVFQFMIGNTDWEVPAQQNLKIIKVIDFNEPAPYVVPYDFDYTGMVNASYAIPAEILGIKSVRERKYWGRCYTEEELKGTFVRFYKQQEAIYQLYQNFALFNKRSLSGSISYLDSFYKIIADDTAWKYEFISNCRP